MSLWHQERGQGGVCGCVQCDWACRCACARSGSNGSPGSVCVRPHRCTASELTPLTHPLHLLQSTDRLMGYKENSVEVANNMPGLMKKEAYA